MLAEESKQMSREIRHAYAASTLNRSRVEITTNHHNDTDLVSYRLNNLMTRKHAATRKFGFTLAEVLITLAIIGIVAALTLPVFITKYQKHQTVSQLKRVYSQLSNAVVASEVVNGDRFQWDLTLSAQNFFIKYFKDFLPVIKECKVGNNKCTSVSVRLPLKNSYDITPVIQNKGDKYSVVLNNGTIIFMSRHENQGVSYLFSVDMNGDKGPNRNGRDVFHFAFTKDGFHGYSHFGSKPGKNRYNMTGAYGGCNRNACCSFARAGGGCSTMIMYDNWQIKKDYPW